mgnify:CR=1 FL=1
MPCCVEGVDLARRPLLGRDLLDVDESALLDADEQRVDGALGDVGEALFTQAEFCIQRLAVETFDGGSVQAMGGSAPRRVAQAAVRAVQQWRFDRLPAERTVDVEINFKAE